jgi:hypothetical protein
VFTQGLVHAAADLGIAYQHADWNDPDLPAKVGRFKPDLFFVVHGRKFVQRWGPWVHPIPTAIWLLDEPYEVDDTSTFSKRFDNVFVNDPATLDRHQHASSLPVCFDPHLHIATSDLKAHAVGFIGGGNPTRERVLGALARAGLLSYVVGGAWGDPDVNARCLAGNISPRETAALYRQTSIVVNIFRERHHFNREQIPATALNPRVYEALACGALVVSEWRPEVETRVPELPTFRTADECVALVADLLANPVRAEALRIRCAARLKPDTYAARLQTVLSVAGAEVAA